MIFAGAGRTSYGYFDFKSNAASQVWDAANTWFPEGTWRALPGNNDVAGWLDRAFIDLKKAADDFKGSQSYKSNVANAAWEQLRDQLTIYQNNTDDSRKEGIARSLENKLKVLMKALPDLEKLRKSDNLRKGVPEAIGKFTDRAATVLKQIAAELENHQRGVSGDPTASWQTVDQTLTLLKFKDRTENIRDLVGDPPPDLRLRKRELGHFYFNSVVGHMDGMDGTSPVKFKAALENLQGMIAIELGPRRDPRLSKDELADLGEATKNLEKLGSALLSRKGNAADRQNVACEAMLYVEALGRTLGRPMAPRDGGPADHKEMEREVVKLRDLAKGVIDAVDEEKREERW